ncbi:ASCH domain-containing protein [Priestia filamentosa]|uniref:ASCH domain-containing protein n=1 Tax=Priestia filamentosa TaxID=1402861 RepID=UPI001E32760E
MNIKGLIIKEPWIDMILRGEKVWEIRSSNTKIRGEIALIKSGTGKVYGTVEIVDTINLGVEYYKETESFHRIPGGKECLPYKKTYGWVLKNPHIFDQPIPYKHPQGAVIWVNLNL